MRRYFSLSLAVCLLVLSQQPRTAFAADTPAPAPASATPTTPENAAAGTPTAASTGAFINFDDEHRYTPLVNPAEVSGKLIEMVDHGKPFRAIFQPDLSGNPRGALLILQHYQDEPGEQALFNVLRQTLAERGWASLTVPMPSPAALPTDPTAARAALEARRAPVIGRLQIAQEYLIQQGLMNMAVLARGEHNLYARWLMEKNSNGGDSKQKLQPLQGWILLDAEDAMPGTSLLTGMDKEKLSTPAIDISTTGEHEAAQQKRRQFAREHQWPKWQSVSYPDTPASSASSAQRLCNRIYGWLEKNIAGRSLTAEVIRQ